MNPAEIQTLYVEDNIAEARLFQKCLQRLGYGADIALDGELGLAQWDTGRYHLLALDHEMPKIPGLELLRRLALRGALPPTVVVTGPGNEQAAVEAVRLGAQDYIIKDPEARVYKSAERSAAKVRLMAGELAFSTRVHVMASRCTILH